MRENDTREEKEARCNTVNASDNIVLNIQLYSGSSTLFGRRTEIETIKKVCFIAHSSMHSAISFMNEIDVLCVPPLYLHSSS